MDNDVADVADFPTRNAIQCPVICPCIRRLSLVAVPVFSTPWQEQRRGRVAQMERHEESDLGWSKTFVNSSIMANLHVAAGRRPALRDLGNTPLTLFLKEVGTGALRRPRRRAERQATEPKIQDYATRSIRSAR